MAELPPVPRENDGQARASRPSFHPKSRLLTAETARGLHPNCRPRDAATLIIVDDSEGEAKVLMGKRHLGHKFMPGKFVFPGGRVEPKDYLAGHRLDLPMAVESKLLRSLKGIAHPGRARALVHAALRETQEETGLVVALGSPANDVGEASGPLSFIARAITPPGRPRRFDTRFFALSASSIAERLEIVDGEFSDIHWLSLSQARQADLPLITRVILDELEERLTDGALSDSARPVPFYFQKGACFHRRVL
jgi:8-oxo-dGTP pyrophosphatase MutT (NUDIX family)